MTEKRQYPRVNKNLPCFMEIKTEGAGDGETYEAVIRDINMNGAFVESPRVFELGQEIALFLSLPESQTLVFGRGEVRWNRIDRKPGMGLCFKRLSFHHGGRTQRFL